MTLTPWFTFTPVAGGRVTHYADAIGGKENYTRTLGEVGFDAAMRASGIFEYKNETWEIDGLRHLIEPKISYRYAPKAADGRAYIPRIDRRTFTTYLPPLSIGDQRNIDDLDRLDTLRFSLNNTLQTRDKTYGSRNLATLNFAADTRFSRQPGQRKFSNIYTEATLTPTPWLRFEVFEQFSTQKTSQQELNYAIEIADQDAWAVRLSSHYLRDGYSDAVGSSAALGYEEYLLDYRVRVSDSLHFIGRWRYDARRKRLNEQSYGIMQRLGQTWDVRYELTFNEGQRRESSYGFNVEVELLKF
jgi:LPS-assembly protein